MKNVFLNILVVFVGFFVGCRTEPDYVAVDSDGFSLYWDHEVFGKEGRRYRFEFTTQKKLLDEFTLNFGYTIQGNNITVRLAGTTSKGQCQQFPGWGGPECTSRGQLYIPEKDLPPGTYTLDLITPTFTERTELIVTSEKAAMNLSSNQQVTSSISEVFPIPHKILFGSIVYAGIDKEQMVNNMIAHLGTLGVTATTLPDEPYRHLDVSQSSHLATQTWPVDNHSISLLYLMKRDSKDILQDFITYYTNTDKSVAVYLYTSEGDEIRLNGSETMILYGGQ